jgi:mono/diheme cytochrome c family protein
MTTPAFWQDKTSEALGKAILQGSSGTAMPGYEGTLDAKQLAALVSYLERFRPGAPAGTR